MPEVLPDPRWNAPRDGNDRFVELTDGRTYLLKEGVDYTNLNATRVALYKLAAFDGLKVQTARHPSGLQVRFLKRDGSPITPPQT